MANQEQLRILKEEGVEAWNKWREENPGIKADLSGVNFAFPTLNVPRLLE